MANGPKLHQFEFYIRDSINDEVIDTKSVRYGIRTVKLQSVYDDILEDGAFRFIVNG